ncbi:hypothetical protein ACQP2U_20880 [Nocardia sp. CA-084685]|uniref:hypothetical protein n=1 Tax=Nocardia sp. CA-084685 TaxID=3239970 RepID=UPI003D97F138
MRFTPERDMLERAIDAAEISPELAVGATLDALLGPLVYCALTGASITRALTSSLVEDLLKPRAREPSDIAVK